MGRKRTIDREAVLEAAQRVVIRDGVARLTLDAVAAEAKISKASVLYDYKTKDALIRAIIENRVAAEDRRVAECVAAVGPGPDAAIRGRIAAAIRSVSDEERAAGLSLCAAAAQHACLRSPIQDSYRNSIDEIEGTSEHPRGALLAFLSLECLAFMEWFGLHSWPAGARDRILADIDWLRSQSPAASRDLHGQPELSAPDKARDSTG